ncbi:MAG: translation initiation factor IF-2 N-terminal domain-containing protein, partial [Puniceicoccaceae bacterium]
MSVRIHQIAKQIGMENKDLLKLLQDRGFAVKSVSSTIDNISAESLVEELGTAPVEAPAPEPEPARPPERPAPKPEFKRPSGPIVRSREEVEREKEAAKTPPPPAPPRLPPKHPAAAPRPPAGRPAAPPPPPPPPDGPTEAEP